VSVRRKAAFEKREVRTSVASYLPLHQVVLYGHETIKARIFSQGIFRARKVQNTFAYVITYVTGCIGETKGHLTIGVFQLLT
jgi:hypothetical protein